MSGIVRWVGSIVVCLAASLTAATQTSTEVGTEFEAASAKILALENAWNQAEERGDVKGMEMLFDDSLIYVTENGQLMTKAAFLASVKEAAKSRTEQIVTESVVVKTYGTVAIVSGVYVARGKKAGSPYTRRGRFVDTWLYRNNVWRCVAVDTTPTH